MFQLCLDQLNLYWFAKNNNTQRFCQLVICSTEQTKNARLFIVLLLFSKHNRQINVVILKIQLLENDWCFVN